MIYNKKRLTAKISNDNSITYTEAFKATEMFLSALEDILLEDEDSGITITNLLSMKTYERSERIGVNPATQEKMTIKARTAVRCRISPTLTRKMNEKE